MKRTSRIARSKSSRPSRKSFNVGALWMIVFLVVSLIVVAVATQKTQNDTRGRAMETGGGIYPTTTPACPACANGYECNNGSCQRIPDSRCGRDRDPGAPVCCDEETNKTCSNRTCEPPNRRECITSSGHCTIDADGCVPTEPPGDPTPTPTPRYTPTATPTLPPLVCQKVEAYRGSTNITNNLASVKLGETITFLGYANSTRVQVKSLRFQLTINNVVVKTVDAPATLSGGVWVAKFTHLFNASGAHNVSVIAVTPL